MRSIEDAGQSQEYLQLPALLVRGYSRHGYQHKKIRLQWHYDKEISSLWACQIQQGWLTNRSLQ